MLVSSNDGTVATVQGTNGMTFTNEKMAVIILSPKLPRQDFAIWLS